MDLTTIIIIVVFVIYIQRGYSEGLIKIVTGFIGLIIIYIISFKFYFLGEDLLKHYFKIPTSLEKPLGILTVFIILIIVLHFISPIIYKKFIPKKLNKAKMNKYLGAMLSLLEGIILVSFIIFLIMNINIYKGETTIQNTIKKSYLGSFIVREDTKILSPFIGADLKKIKMQAKLVTPSK
jgi:uncharacterized membrane protein required for colicin V production